uniref:Death domain-containing protein n=1 Tax=Strigamia maritima TaxID=126957 RepID=T1J7N3_STRMM
MTKEGAPTVKEDGEQHARTESPVANQDQTDGNASFLRAARAGNLDRVLEYLKGSIDINTSNANGLNALHLASKEGHVNVVTELLKRGANVDAATKKGNTALHIASLAGQEEIVKILVQQSASVNVQSQNGFTPLYMAAQENHDSVVKFLLSNGANQSLATEDGFTPLAVALQQGHDKVVAVLLENDTRGKVRLPALHIAAKKDDCKAAALLLQNDHNPDVTSKSGFTPLHIAAHYGNDNIANLLLQRGADVNFAAKHNITPMHVAAKWGKVNMVTVLLDKQANVEASTRDGLTPLHCAARSGHDQVVDLLLEKAAPITAKTKNGLAPLHMACQGDHVDSARILLYHKAPVDDVTIDYLTALHVAAHCGHVRVAKLLLDRKADPNARALNGFTPLHIACKKNRIKVVELLLKHGASIEATTESGLTPLHVASFMGCMNIVIYLIQHGSNPDVPTVRGETPLHLAARANQTDIIRILLRNGAHVDARAREQQTPLHIAARLGNSDIVALLLQHGAAVDSTTKDMYTALHIAAKEGQEEVASVLLEHGASLTATTKKGFTPLHLAAKYGNMKVARLLLQRDAPVDAQGKNGVTPLHVAAHYDNQNVALLLLDKGASPHATAKNGYTPLHIAAKKNQMDIGTTLLEYGAKSNAESKAGFTPLHLAAQEGHTDMSTLLLEHHADVNCKAKNGLTPLHLCAQEDKVNVAAILVKNGAEIDSKTKAGYTPLHVACHFGQMNMVRFLLQHGADVNTTTAVGYTPLHQASQQGHTQIVNLLLENRASPNAVTNQGQTALSIAQRLGYISVVETLKIVTETVVTTTTTTVTEEKYRVVAPETMQETFMSDSEDEGAAFGVFARVELGFQAFAHFLGEDTMLGDQSYRYLTVDEMKSLGDDSLPIMDPTRDERMEMHLVKDTLLSAAPPAMDDDRISPQPPQGYAQFTGNYAPDNIDISRSPIHAGFLVSFMVDARGGAMRGCRHSGVRVIIPPRKAPMPTRITCRYLKKEKLAHPPPLMEGEACASRILEVGPTGAKFLGPVIIEVPHFASLRGKEREITILRSDNGETWREHTLEASEEAVQEVLNESFDGEELSALEDLNTNRITRILTTDFPQYFAIITRVRQEVHAIGPEGGMVSSTVVPQVQAVFPEGALTKKIKVGLQAQPIPADLVAKMLGNRVAVSPVVTVEPRRRKFHKPITLTIPVPQAASRGMINQYSGETPTLRLLCSITGGITRAQWEDVTGSTPLTFVNDCVSFTTTVSARFWLMDCRNISEATKMATELYREAIHVPFMAKFVVFAKRIDPVEAKLRVFCMTDDKEDKTLENQEHFSEVAKSRDVEVLENKSQYVEFAGNLIPVTKSGEQLALNFHAFRENRLPFIVREKDPNQEPIGRIAFMKEPKGGRSDPPQTPICNLNITLPDADASPTGPDVLTLEKKYAYLKEMGLSKPETIHKADLRLSDIANLLGNDWVVLALQLDIPESDINLIKTDYPDDVNQQALVMLRLWMQLAGNKATGNNLEKALRKTNREDIVNQCIFNVELVTDDVERAVAKVRLDQSGFDSLKEELGPSRETSLRRDMSLDVSYDEKDIMKEAESAEETSSETGSIADQKTARPEIIDTDLHSSPGKVRPEVPKRPILRSEPAKPPRCRPTNRRAEIEDPMEETINRRAEPPAEIDAWVEYLTKTTPPSSPVKKKVAPKIPERPKIVGEMTKKSTTPEPPRAKLEREFEEMLKNLAPVTEDEIKARVVEPMATHNCKTPEVSRSSSTTTTTTSTRTKDGDGTVKTTTTTTVTATRVVREGDVSPGRLAESEILVNQDLDEISAGVVDGKKGRTVEEKVDHVTSFADTTRQIATTSLIPSLKTKPTHAEAEAEAEPEGQKPTTTTTTTTTTSTKVVDQRDETAESKPHMGDEEEEGILETEDIAAIIPVETEETKESKTIKMTQVIVSSIDAREIPTTDATSTSTSTSIIENESDDPLKPSIEIRSIEITKSSDAAEPTPKETVSERKSAASKSPLSLPLSLADSDSPAENARHFRSSNAGDDKGNGNGNGNGKRQSNPGRSPTVDLIIGHKEVKTQDASASTESRLMLFNGAKVPQMYEISISTESHIKITTGFPSSEEIKVPSQTGGVVVPIHEIAQLEEEEKEEEEEEEEVTVSLEKGVESERSETPSEKAYVAKLPELTDTAVSPIQTEMVSVALSPLESLQTVTVDSSSSPMSTHTVSVGLSPILIEDFIRGKENVIADISAKKLEIELNLDLPEKETIVEKEVLEEMEKVEKEEEKQLKESQVPKIQSEIISSYKEVPSVDISQTIAGVEEIDNKRREIEVVVLKDKDKLEEPALTKIVPYTDEQVTIIETQELEYVHIGKTLIDATTIVRDLAVKVPSSASELKMLMLMLMVMVMAKVLRTLQEMELKLCHRK